MTVSSRWPKRADETPAERIEVVGYRFSCSRHTLARAVRTAAGVIRTGRRTLDHDGVWIEIDGSWMTMTVTRPPVTVEQRIPIDGTGAGSLVLPIEPFRSVVLSRRSGDAEFEGDNRSIEFRSRSFHAQLTAIPPNTVVAPEGPVAPLATAVIGGDAFRSGLDHTVLSMSHRYSWRPDPAGLAITADNGTLRFAATNLETLAIAEFREPSLALLFDRPLIVPPEAMEDLGRHLPKRRRVEIRMGARQMSFVAGDTSIRVMIEPQRFPDYEPLRSTSTTRLARVPRARLLLAVERMAAFARENPPARIWLDLEAASVRTWALDRQLGSGSEACPAGLHGDPCTIGLHLWTLVAVLRRLNGYDVMIDVGDPRRRASFFDPDEPTHRYHMLPLAIDAIRQR